MILLRRNGGFSSVHATVWILALQLVSAPSASSGTTGILQGVVVGRETHEPLPGVNISLPVLQRGTVTDDEGGFELQNLPPGRYDVRVTHVSYRTVMLKDVVIQPDIRTRLSIELEPANVELSEIVVQEQTPPIQTEVTGTAFHFTGEELSVLPVDYAADAIGLKPGVTMEGNVRGGKVTEVLYLVDGLPVRDILSGELSVSLPKSSITGMSITTGGFEPEYGNALSGIVNIVTKTGANTPRIFIRADKDDLYGTQVSKATTFDVLASGPLKENTAFYTASISGLLTDTRWWQDFQYFFPSPVEKNLNGFAKFAYLFDPATRLDAQVLYAHHDWRDYEFDWRFDLSGLPPESRDSYRLAAIFSKTPSEHFSYTASLSSFFIRSRIGTGSSEDVPANNPYQYDFFLQYVVSGQRAWWEDSKQATYTGKFDGLYRPAREHLVKFGAEVNLYNLLSDIVKYEPRRTFFGKPIIDQPQLDFSTNYAYHPRSGSLYVQDKIDVLGDGSLINVGIRYDILDPLAFRPDIEAIPVSDTAYSFVTQRIVKASIKQQISPRFGATMPLGEETFLFVNLGWYIQYPLFEYLYSGLDRVALAKGLTAITGNPDLDPERTFSYEISVKHAFTSDVVASATYFSKQTTNPIDTKTFVPGDSKLAGTFGFAEYVNTPHADCYGLELVLSREKGSWLTGEFSYTYMVAEGTSGSAQDAFYLAQFGFLPAVRSYPLSWDQRHTVKLSAQAAMKSGTTVSLAAEYHTGRPYTYYPTSTGFAPVTTAPFAENNARMPDCTNIDLRAEQVIDLGFWSVATVKMYADIRNLLDARNVSWMDSNGRIGGELGDPSGYFVGRRTRVGLQVEF